MAIIDYVYVNDVGRVQNVHLGVDGALPSPTAGAGSAGYVGITSDPDRAAIIVGTMEYIGAPAWSLITDPIRIVNHGEWWINRLTYEELLFIEQSAVTDSTVAAYLAILEATLLIDLDATGDGSMQGFHAYLKATFVGDAGFWVDNDEADARFDQWFEDWTGT